METLPTDTERQLRLISALPAIAWSASAETFQFTFVSPAAETILGYPTQRWLDEPGFWGAHIHPDDRHVITLCVDATKGGRSHELVYRMVAMDGRSVWLRDYVNVHSENGVAVELFGVMVDITREREAEEASLLSRENFRRMVELSPDCIGVHADGSYVYVNQAFVQLLGATSESEIVGQPVLSFVDPAYLQAVQERHELLRAGESVPYLREKLKRIDGSLVDVELAALPIQYGDHPAVQVIARDITDRLRAERALAASEQRYRTLVDEVRDILFVVDNDGRFVSLSRSFERITGYTTGEWLGRPFSEIFFPDTAARAVEQFHRTLSGQGGTITYYQGQARSGAMLTVEVSSQRRYLDGVLAGAIGMARDVTEEKLVATRLEDAKRLSSLGQVAASLAHEFNNVLMGILPFVEVIRRKTEHIPGVSEAAGHITRAIARGKRASQEILRFANPKDPLLSTIDLRTWLPNVLGQLVAALPSVALSSSVDPRVRMIRGDREQLEQILTNVAYNAREAMTGEGTVHIDITPATEVATGQPFARICVRNDGPAIPADHLDRIFEPLFTTKRNGSGLGLAIARQLIERQGGTMHAENLPAGGCAFHLLIPLAGELIAETAAPEGVSWGVRRVLLVEDDESVGFGLKALLEAEGYEVAWAKTAGDARQAAFALQPQVAIIDVNLPDGSGIDLIPILREQHRDLPVILSTGHVEVHASSDDRYLVSLMKPYELDDLLAAIARVTEEAA